MKKMILVVATLLLVGTGCQKCVKSHDAVRHVEANPIYSSVKVGKSFHRIKTGTRPAHDETYTICDQYEESK